MKKQIKNLLDSVDDLLKSTELNLDEMEPETENNIIRLRDLVIDVERNLKQKKYKKGKRKQGTRWKI